MTQKAAKDFPIISSHLLWEYNLDDFDFDRSQKIVIERVIERGSLEDWREMFRYYGEEQILEAARQSKQLTAKDKNFTEVFIHSTFLHAA